MAGTIRGTLIDNYGRPISGATVTVKKAGTETLANLYSDFALTVAATNPITTEADGSYFAYAPNGFYDIVPAKAGTTFDTTDSSFEFVYDPRINRTLTGLSETVDERDVELFCDASAGNQVVNLPALSGSGKFYFFWKVDSSANTVTLDPNGSELINGVSTLVMSDRYDGVFLTDNTGGWLAFEFDTTTIQSILDLRLPIVIKTNDYTLTKDDHVVIANKATAIQFTLPALGDVSGGGFDKEYWIRNIGAGLLTVSGTVDGVVNPTLAQYESMVIYGDGSTWRALIGEGASIRVKSLRVESTTKVTNLNADRIDDKDPTDTPAAAALPLADADSALDSWISPAFLRLYVTDFRLFLSTTFSSFVNGNRSSVTYQTDNVSLLVGDGISGGSFDGVVYSAEAFAPLVSGKKFAVNVLLYNYARGSGNSGEAHFYMTQQTPGSAAPLSTTANHFGFKTDVNRNLFASNANGTTETSTDTAVDLSDGAVNPVKILTMVVLQGVYVRFYVDGVLKATHTTNLPAAGNYRFAFSIRDGQVGGDTTDARLDFRVMQFLGER